jgi:two-component system response regulator NreC
MGVVSGFEATREIRAQLPGTKVLVLTMHEDGEYLRQAIQAGATGFVIKKAASAELAVAIRAVRRGEFFVYPTLTRVLLGDMVPDQQQTPAQRDNALELLSQREKEVLGLLAQGNTSRQIAQSLYLSVRTVETYRARLMEKLGLKTRVALVRFALQHGLLDDVIQPPPAPEA